MNREKGPSRGRCSIPRHGTGSSGLPTSFHRLHDKLVGPCSGAYQHLLRYKPRPQNSKAGADNRTRPDYETATILCNNTSALQVNVILDCLSLKIPQQTLRKESGEAFGDISTMLEGNRETSHVKA